MNVMDLHEHLLRLARDRAEEERAMTMTPDKLREKGNRWRELGQYDLADIYNQHAAALEEIERLNAAWKAQQFHLEAEERESAHWQERAEKAERRAERLQAKVDALMLEYCPDEMTPEQLAEWEKHQRAVPAERRAERLKVHAEESHSLLIRAMAYTPTDCSLFDDMHKRLKAYRADKGE